MSSSILVVEDTDTLRDSLCTYLRSEGYRVTAASSAEDALEKQEDFAVVLSDLKLPGKNGLEFLEHFRQIHDSVPVVMMTAFGTIDMAVEAMKLGAKDFITKPFDPNDLGALVEKYAEKKGPSHETIKGENKRPRSFLTQNPRMEQILHYARKVAPLDSSVLILGESGTGKELVARYIHQCSKRCDEVFIGVNCGSMPADLLESEFFGHEAGAFTGATEQRIGLFEEASSGTLFLDEIGTMPHHLQMKLLRTLQEDEIRRVGSTKMKKVNTRVISATNCDIEAAIKKKKFREDLFYRLGVVILELPPLRERPEDIELLTKHFIRHYAKEFHRDAPSITDGALELLQTYYWPGNVRELENSVQRAMIFAGPKLTAEAFELGAARADSEQRSLAELTAHVTRTAEIEAISRALSEAGGNKSKAATMLSVSYKTLLNKVKEYGLDRKKT